MIIRILGVGQYRLDEVDHQAANAIDEKVQAAYDAGDEAAFHAAVQELSALVQSAGTPLEVDEFVGSDAVVPGPDTTLEEAHQLLSSEGLIPG